MEKEIMYRIRGVTKDYLVGKKAMPALREINFRLPQVDDGRHLCAGQGHYGARR